MIHIDQVTLKLTPISTAILILTFCCYIYMKRRMSDTKRDDILKTLINIILKLFN